MNLLNLIVLSSHPISVGISYKHHTNKDKDISFYLNPTSQHHQETRNLTNARSHSPTREKEKEKEKEEEKSPTNSRPSSSPCSSSRMVLTLNDNKDRNTNTNKNKLRNMDHLSSEEKILSEQDIPKFNPTINIGVGIDSRNTSANSSSVNLLGRARAEMGESLSPTATTAQRGTGTVVGSSGSGKGGDKRGSFSPSDVPISSPENANVRNKNNMLGDIPDERSEEFDFGGVVDVEVIDTAITGIGETSGETSGGGGGGGESSAVGVDIDVQQLFPNEFVKGIEINPSMQPLPATAAKIENRAAMSTFLSF